MKTNYVFVSGIILCSMLGVAVETSVAAADLGADCCVDLEERIAELESTTARKGNRKISVTVSGYVNENVMGGTMARSRMCTS